jgi:NADH-quinone oxidoreductase subunit G
MSVNTAENIKLIHLTIDGREVSVPKGTTVYAAALKLGIEIPIFCYQDRMPPFGACRMCLVEVEKMPKLQTSCTLEVTEGMAVKTQTEMAVNGRKGILEFLLINHPLDCPICDRGGECPLQDNALKYGPGLSRFFEEKRHFKKHLPLGPVLTLDRERCIVCARCTRFGELIAGDHALEFIDRGYKTEVGTPDGEAVKSKFIGNTIMICPVGALTSQVYRFRARPWDNHSTESTCTLCPVGCSLILDSRDGEIVRTRSSENLNVNDIWLCDKGWFGYEFASHPNRLQKPMIRRNGKLEEAGWEEAFELIVEKIVKAKPGGKLSALGGNPLTFEENYLFQKLMRDVIGVNHIDHRVGMPLFNLDEEGIMPGMEMTIGECEKLDFAYLLGSDLTEEFPIIWLRLKQAINHGAKVTFIGHFAPEISSHLEKTMIHPPGEELANIRSNLPKAVDLAEKGKKGAIFVGRQYLASPMRQAILVELSQYCQNKGNLKLNILEGRGNSLGARLAGMHPEVGPFGERLSKPGLNAIQMLENASGSGWDFLYAAGADPAKHYPSLWNGARAKLNFLIVQDLFLTETASQADVVLPTLSFLEKRGSFVNIERRVQKLQPGKIIPNSIYSDGEIFTQLAQKLNVSLSQDSQFTNLLKQNHVLQIKRDEFKKEPPSNNGNGLNQEQGNGLYASFAPALFDEGVRMKHNPHLIQMAKTPYVRLHPQEAKKRGIPDKSSVKISAKNHSITAKAKWDERVAEGTLVIPLGFDQVRGHDLGAYLMNGLLVEMTPAEGSY